MLSHNDIIVVLDGKKGVHMLYINFNIRLFYSLFILLLESGDN